MLVAKLAVERLVDAILPRLARVDERRLDLRGQQPAQHGSGDELGAVIRPQIARRPMHTDEPREDLNDAAGSNAARDVDRQALARELVDDGQTLQRPAVGAGIEHEVVGPDVIGTVCRQRPRP